MSVITTERRGYMSLIFAHRGASGDYPENTLLAFEKAVEQHCDGIELDVHYSKDGELVVIHDFALDRTTSGKGYVKDYTLEELKSFDAGSWLNSSFNHCTIPTLKEVLEFAKSNSLYLNIELKAGSMMYPAIEERILSLVKSYDYLDQCMFSSFDHHALVKMRELSEEAYTGILYSSNMIEPWSYCEKLKANALHPFYQTVSEELLRSCYQRDIEVNTYTVNDFESIRRLNALGTNVIITNYPHYKQHLYTD